MAMEGNREAETGGIAVVTWAGKVPVVWSEGSGLSGLSGWSVCSVGPCCSGVPRSSLFLGGLAGAGGSCPDADCDGSCPPPGG